MDHFERSATKAAERALLRAVRHPTRHRKPKPVSKNVSAVIGFFQTIGIIGLLVGLAQMIFSK